VPIEVGDEWAPGLVWTCPERKELLEPGLYIWYKKALA